MFILKRKECTSSEIESVVHCTADKLSASVVKTYGRAIDDHPDTPPAQRTAIGISENKLVVLPFEKDKLGSQTRSRNAIRQQQRRPIGFREREREKKKYHLETPLLHTHTPTSDRRKSRPPRHPCRSVTAADVALQSGFTFPVESSRILLFFP